MCDWITCWLESSGYLGIFALMLVENLFPPIPSELIMPLAGYMSARGDLSLPLVIVCPTGSRAQRAHAVLRKLGYENARVLSGGLAAWRAANLPVDKTASA